MSAYACALSKFQIDIITRDEIVFERIDDRALLVPEGQQKRALRQEGIWSVSLDQRVAVQASRQVHGALHQPCQTSAWTFHVDAAG